MFALRTDETWKRLLEWTYGQTPSERLAAQILYASDFKDIDPTHPLGGRDGGKDAICTKDGNKWVMAVYFPRGQMSLKDITKKFSADLQGAKTNNAFGIAFVTNQELTDSERDALKALGANFSPKISVELFHIERITALLDTPVMAGVRYQYLFIPFVQASSNRDTKLFGDLLAALPSSCTALKLLKSHDFGRAFSSNDVDVLTSINQSWQDVRYQFVDAELNTQRNKFFAELEKFLRKLCNSTDEVREGRLTIGMADFEDDPEKLALQESLNELSRSVYNEHQALIKICMTKLPL